MKRCRRPGRTRALIPGSSRCVRTWPASSSSTRSRAPRCTKIDSSFCTWYWRLRECPASTWISLPAYRSVIAHRNSYPQRLSMRPGPPAGRLLFAGFVAVTRKADVVPIVRVWSDELFEVGQDRRQRLFIRADHLGDHQPRENAVALRDVAAERESPRLLAPQQRIGVAHGLADVLEADGRLVHGDAEALAKGVHHARRRERAHDVASLPTLLEQIHGEERHHLQLIDIAPMLVDDADTVSVAVIGDTDIEAALRHALHRVRHVALDRLRMHAAEPGVALRVQLRHGGGAALERARQK